MSTLHKGKGALLLLALTLTCIMVSQNSHAQYKKRYIKNWISWNGLFKEGIDSVKQSYAINKFKSEIAALSPNSVDGVEAKKGKLTQYLIKYNKKKGIKPGEIRIRKIIVKYCSNNDPLLWNISADVEINHVSTDTADGSTVIVTPPKPRTTPAGDALVYLDENKLITLPMDQTNVLVPEKVFGLPSMSIDDSAVIAILDTGIDTTLLAEGMRTQILWNGAGGSRNLQRNADPSKYSDDHPLRHGTAVAVLAINSFYQSTDSTKVPKLMVLKIMDSLGRGTIFELCCGLSYAADNRATVINTSMGFYGRSYNVLKHYAEKCRNYNIPVVAAAGNDTLDRTQGLECSEDVNDHNKLKDPGHLFYPGSLANDKTKYSVISVTGFKLPGIPCFYQNYSEEFVTMGVMNQSAETNCCKYQVPFINSMLALEGSSFATPVVSGKLAYFISRMGRRNNVDDYIRMMQVLNAPATSTRPAVTQGNQYLTY